MNIFIFVFYNICLYVYVLYICMYLYEYVFKTRTCWFSHDPISSDYVSIKCVCVCVSVGGSVLSMRPKLHKIWLYIAPLLCGLHSYMSEFIFFRCEE